MHVEARHRDHRPLPRQWSIPMVATGQHHGMSQWAAGPRPDIWSGGTAKHSGLDARIVAWPHGAVRGRRVTALSHCRAQPEDASPREGAPSGATPGGAVSWCGRFRSWRSREGRLTSSQCPSARGDSYDRLYPQTKRWPRQKPSQSCCMRCSMASVRPRQVNPRLAAPRTPGLSIAVTWQ